MIELKYAGSYAEELTKQIALATQRCGHAFAARSIRTGSQDIHICGCLVAAQCTSCDDIMANLVQEMVAKPQEALLFYQFTHEFKIEARDHDELCDLSKLARKCGSNMCNKLCIEGLSMPVAANISLSASSEHLEQIISGLYDLHKRQQFCDIELQATECGRGGIAAPKIPLHKVVLAAASEYFRGKWANKYHDSSLETLEVQEVSAKTLDDFVKFIYTGSVSLAGDEAVVQLCILADLWQVSSLTSVCMCYIENCLGPSETVKIIGLGACATCLKQAAMVRFVYIIEHAERIPFPVDACMEVFSHANEQSVVPDALLNHALKHAAIYVGEICGHAKFNEITLEFLEKIIDLSFEESMLGNLLCQWGKTWQANWERGSVDYAGSGLNALLPLWDLWEPEAPPVRKRALTAAIKVGLRSCPPHIVVKILNEAHASMHHEQLIMAAIKIVQEWLAEGFRDLEGALENGSQEITFAGMVTALRCMPLTSPGQLCRSLSTWNATLQVQTETQSTCPNTLLEKCRPLSYLFSTPGMPLHALQAIALSLQDELDGIGLHGVVGMLNQATNLQVLLHPRIVRQKMFVEGTVFGTDVSGEYLLLGGVRRNDRPVYRKQDTLIWHDNRRWLITNVDDFEKQTSYSCVSFVSDEYTPDAGTHCWEALETLYLPIKSRGKTVLKRDGANMYVADNTELGSTSNGIGYRRRKKFSDKPVFSLKWGSRIKGKDEGDGWISIASSTDGTEKGKVMITCCSIRVDGGIVQSGIVLCRAAAMILRAVQLGSLTQARPIFTKLQTKTLVVLSLLLSECAILESLSPFDLDDSNLIPRTVTVPEIYWLLAAFSSLDSIVDQSPAVNDEAASETSKVAEAFREKSFVMDGDALSIRVTQCFSEHWSKLFYRWATAADFSPPSRHNGSLPDPLIRLSQLAAAIDGFDCSSFPKHEQRPQLGATLNKLRDATCIAMQQCLENMEDEALPVCILILDGVWQEDNDVSCDVLARAALHVSASHLKGNNGLVAKFSASTLSQVLTRLETHDVINPILFLQEWAQQQVFRNCMDARTEVSFSSVEAHLAVLVALLQRVDQDVWQAEAWKAAETELAHHSTGWARCLELYRDGGESEDVRILAEIASCLLVQGFESFVKSSSFFELSAEEFLAMASEQNLETVDIRYSVDRWMKRSFTFYDVKKAHELVQALEAKELDWRIVRPCLRVVAATMAERLDDKSEGNIVSESKCQDGYAAEQAEKHNWFDEKTLWFKEKQVMLEECERLRRQVAAQSTQLIRDREKMYTLQAAFESFSRTFSLVSEIANTPLEQKVEVATDGMVLLANHEIEGGSRHLSQDAPECFDIASNGSTHENALHYFPDNFDFGSRGDGDESLHVKPHVSAFLRDVYVRGAVTAEHRHERCNAHTDV